MIKKQRREIPEEKIIVITHNTKKIDFTKKYKFVYFDWWFHLLTLPAFLFCYLLGLLCALYCGLRVTGRKNKQILKKQGCITISNHCHYFDTVFASLVLFPQRLYISVAQRNYEVPIIRRILRIVRAFPIPAKPNAGLQMIVPPVGEALKRGHHVHFLPEGDLVYLSQEIFRFKRGAFYLSYIHQAPILPMVYIFTRRYLFGKEQSPHWPKMRLVIGEPFFPPPLRTDGIYPSEAIDDMMEKAANWMEDTIAFYHSNNIKDKGGAS
ncbi:MAG: 1-acyl-sn-glycerol-3-phosphate acyltransferase [Verrucomicrobia bacterium]|nr:1-acyl-sn-glycerol-3-phosphate acyltransferase [Verrucomicrobiota bacterium]MBU1735483.1 1-acyl-sn-glycerol-3-phosphate acyltransferase [Verrucomicrobiota bacterium]MBU1856878.1 1-acyl-sn-glycerol-3-phosphate acyltransferase [Verrucomicrobiota bacterium]